MEANMLGPTTMTRKNVNVKFLDGTSGEPLQDTVAERITRRDEEALQHLEDVRLVRPSGGGVIVEFVFRPNPCFRNRVLRRGVVATGVGLNSGVCRSSVLLAQIL